MKAAFYFSIREIRRRPRHFLAQTIVSAAILTTIIMMLMYMNANWRDDVMPEKSTNYHFTLQGLTESEKNYVRSKQYVLACYDVERYISYGESADDTINVRIIWSENNNASVYARELFDELDLWSREPYERYYQSKLKSSINDLKKTYKTTDEYYLIDSNTTLLKRAETLAKNQVVQSKKVRNISYCRSVMNNYIMQPQFFMLVNLIALFLGGVMMILHFENYRALMPEYGALRSFGLKSKQLFYINGFHSIMSSLAAIPIGSITAFIAIQIYLVLNKDILADDSIYFKLTQNIPISVILAMSLVSAAVSLLGAMLVCFYYRNRSTMQLLKREGSVQVSFVAKTSPRFERAKNANIYSSLQLRRTKVTFILMTAIIAIMLPLPVSFLAKSGEILFNSDGFDKATLAKGLYYLFQALILFITSVIVIYVAARSYIDDRHGELAILTSLGMNKKQINRTVYPSCIWQIVATTVPAVALIFYITDEMTYMPTSSPDRVRGLHVIEFIKIFSTDVLGIILIIAPAILFGAVFSLIRFRRRSVIESIRENE